MSAGLDGASRQWVEQLRVGHPRHDQTVRSLHDVLGRVALFELSRRRHQLRSVTGPEFEDVAQQAAGDALVTVLGKLDEFRGLSRFTTWVYKFALLEAAVKLRRRAWQSREVPLEPESWDLLSSTALTPEELVEQGELISTVQRLIGETLTPHQRRVLVALALNGVPIDILAEQLSTTRGALYKTLHDARRKLRQALTDTGLAFETRPKEMT